MCLIPRFKQHSAKFIVIMTKLVELIVNVNLYAACDFVLLLFK